MPPARLPLSWWVTKPSSAIIGTAVAAAGDPAAGDAPAAAPPSASEASTSSASASRKNALAVTTWSTLPSRCSARSRRLARTDVPTRNAPASTDTATPTPATTARLMRQKWVRLRISRVMEVMVAPRRLAAVREALVPPAGSSPPFACSPPAARF